MSLPLSETACASETIAEDTNDDSSQTETKNDDKSKKSNRLAAMRARMQKRSRKRDQNEVYEGNLSPFNQFILLLQTSLDIKSQRALDPSCFIDYITLLTLNFCGNAQKILLHSQTHSSIPKSSNNNKIDNKVINIASIAPIFRLEPLGNGGGDDNKEDENHVNIGKVGCYDMGVDFGVFIDGRGNYNDDKEEGYPYYLNTNFEWNMWDNIGRRWPHKKVACIIVNKNNDNICICSGGSYTSTCEMINGENPIQLLKGGICYFWTQADTDGSYGVYGIDQNLSV